MVQEYDILVVGAGHAGCEAAYSAAKMGMKTLLLTINLDTIAQMSCNPAIGGIGKGNMVREIDALGGLMAQVIDQTGIHFRMLNTKKGAAVQAPRAQADKKLYQFTMKYLLEQTENLHILQEMVDDIVLDGRCIRGVVTSMGRTYLAKAVIITAGTFLRGLVLLGDRAVGGGRMGDSSSDKLSLKLFEKGFVKGRLKTGTPPRINMRTIDLSQLEIQEPDENPEPFSFETEKINRPQVPCYITRTNPTTHQIIRDNLHLSALYSGKIEGVGPRYCPSLEDKVVRFSQKDSHHVFLEPEGLQTLEVYANGLSNSLAQDVQDQILRSVKGLEKAQILRYGYAVEYDFFPPTQLHHTLETKGIEGLYFAGQINGTSGYEEAGGQGLWASINAVLKIQEKEPFILGRHEAYLGVMVDDLVTQGTKEPYRMFTSRAEYRLLLRHGNADARLTPYGYQLGLISEDRHKKFTEKQNRIRNALALLKKKHINGKPLFKLVCQPSKTIQDLIPLATELGDLHRVEQKEVELEAKYEGYIQRQKRSVEKFRHMEEWVLPGWLDYDQIPQLKQEARQKLLEVQPRSLGQAGRISGVTPADISILMIHLKRGKPLEKTKDPKN